MGKRKSNTSFSKLGSKAHHGTDLLWVGGERVQMVPEAGGGGPNAELRHRHGLVRKRSALP